MSTTIGSSSCYETNGCEESDCTVYSDSTVTSTSEYSVSLDSHHSQWMWFGNFEVQCSTGDCSNPAVTVTLEDCGDDDGDDIEYEDCAVVYSHGTWNDESCSSSYPCVCFDSGSSTYHVTSESYAWDECDAACGSSVFACISDADWRDQCDDNYQGPSPAPTTTALPTVTPQPTTAAACYDAVNNKGCSSYIHMDDFATYGISGGSTTLEECAAAVKSYDGQDGCLGDYFFYEDGGYCNCPVDACTEASENGNAGGSGQLYEFTACMSCVSFSVSSDSMNYEAGKTYCASIGASLAAIYDTSELGVARDVIASAGIYKAITSAECTDGNGWSWGGTDAWENDGFPLNTGEVTDQVACSGFSGIYSLHASGDSFVWDADGTHEEFPVLCRHESDGCSNDDDGTVQEINGDDDDDDDDDDDNGDNPSIDAPISITVETHGVAGAAVELYKTTKELLKGLWNHLF